MQMNKVLYSVITILILGVVVLSSVFIVDQRKIAIVFQFGEAVKIIEKPGLNFKIPLVQNVVLFDNRILYVNAEAKELTAADGKRIIVDSFAKYKITDPVKFFKTVQTYEGADLRLSRILESSM